MSGVTPEEPGMYAQASKAPFWGLIWMLHSSGKWYLAGAEVTDHSRIPDDLVRLVTAGAPVRPNREALSQAIYAHQSGNDEIIWHEAALPSGTERGIWSMKARALADALLAADHLWAEEPTVEDVSEIVKTAITQQMLVPVGVPVVDRAALARAFASEMAINAGRSYYQTAVDALAKVSGLFVDRVTVEAEQREKDAAIAADKYNAEPGWHTFYQAAGIGIAAAIRAGERS